MYLPCLFFGVALVSIARQTIEETKGMDSQQTGPDVYRFKLIDPKFSTSNTDLVAMLRGVQAISDSIVTQVLKGVDEGEIDQALLNSALCSLIWASARAQEEYVEVVGNDPSLPSIWPKAVFP